MNTTPDKYAESLLECCGLCKSALGTADNLLCSFKNQPYIEYPTVKFYGGCPNFQYRMDVTKIPPRPDKSETDMTKVQPMTWDVFKSTGLLWFINRMLHIFGWAIIVKYADVIRENQVIAVYPARVGYRGFSESSEEQGFRKVTEHLVDIADELLDEVKKC